MTSCADNGKEKYYRYEGFVLGTTYHFVIGDVDTTGMQQSFEQLFEQANMSMSLYDENSLLSRVNRAETDSVDIHIAHCIELAHEVSEMSGGVYDVTVKPLSKAYGFLYDNADVEINVDSLLQFVGYKKIKVENGRLIREVEGVQIDLNSIAKGYIVDLVAEMVRAKGAQNYMVEIGGEVMCGGVNPKGEKWVIGIDVPEDGSFVAGKQLQAKVAFTEMGLATSGNYRKFYYNDKGEKIVHTINPLTGKTNPSNLLSATVVADNCAMADALATMLMAMGLDDAKEFLQTNQKYAGYLIYGVEGGKYQDFANEPFNALMIK